MIGVGCSVEGCAAGGRRIRGMCNKHYIRVQRHGDVHADNTARGEANPAWKGDEASYEAIHMRVRAERGSAREHECVDCGGPAAEWSYDHTDPNEKTARRGNSLVAYSTDLSRYVPRCVRDHRAYDREKEEVFA